MRTDTLLTHLGLSRKESRTYLTLLDSGVAHVSDIAKRTGVHRPDIYKSLTLLEKKGLVSKVPRGKRTFYSATSPRKLESLLTTLANELEHVLPDLKRRFETQSRRPTVQFLEGARGIRLVYDDIVSTLKRGEIFYRYSSPKSYRPRGKYVPKDYTRRRDAKKIERYVITSASSRAQKRPRLERYIKIVPENYDLFEYNITQLIYANKIAFIDYNTETATIIENPVIAEFQRNIFKLLFSKL